MNILITGGAGFIGFHLSKRLLTLGLNIVSIDNINDYYSIDLKQSRLKNVAEFAKQQSADYQFVELDLIDKAGLDALFAKYQFDVVINLAAQAGVRYSIENPQAYIDSNLTGFSNILECCRHNHIKHLLFASSSSVYGMNEKQPFSTSDNVDYPISLYAATKKSNELLAFSYSHLYQIPMTGLRFFTVYGPWGRPDMAYFSFTKAIMVGEEINVFNHGKMKRDFTYIDDIVSGVEKLINNAPENKSHKGTNAQAPYSIYNIGNNQPVTLMRFIQAIETACDKEAVKNYLPMQAGDVPITYADIDSLHDAIGFSPSTSIEDGINKFVQWYREYYL